MPSYKSSVVKTQPFDDQKPGTSGLRKKVVVFQKANYTENFVQSILNAVGLEKIQGATLVVGGDGRYFLKEAIQHIVRICAANGLSKLLIGQDGILSTPAISNLIRKNQVLGGIILTASHNPGGPTEDFGIKYNGENGSAATDDLTSRMYELSTKISEYKYTDLPIDGLLNQPGVYDFTVDGRKFTVEVISSTEDYVELMKEVFDFPKLRKFLQKPFNVLIDSMNGVTGPYVQRIFVDELGANLQKNTCRVVPLEDFGGAHPDPNLTYAKSLVDQMKTHEEYDFGAAFDGDGDRNMVIGKKAFFVTPSDSVAILANNLQCIPYFQKNGVHGLARSMPTASAIDRVAEKLGMELFETPTGWKYFGNLMDAGRLSLCGEESFGTGSDHIREKDGVWAILAWLSILEHKNKSVEDVVKDHWKEYGRNYYTRYDYEACETDDALKLFAHLEAFVAAKDTQGKVLTAEGKSYKIRQADDFSYTDPIDHSVATKQGIRVLFEDGSRLIYRKSGTGSSGQTIRVYIDSYEKEDYLGDAALKLSPLVNIALDLCKIKEFTGREEPTVIT